MSEATPVWPGDPPWSLSLAASIADGAPANVGSLQGTTHAGTHADAPLHVDPLGDSVDRLPLDAFLGPAWLLDLSGAPEPIAAPDRAVAAEPLTADELSAAAPEHAERLLLFTGCDWSGGFPTEFRSLDPGAARWCVARGLRLVGTDAPSIEAYAATSLESHRILAAGGVAILESLDLAGITPGGYELVALPLRLLGGDASPVRAAIRPLSRPPADEPS